MADLQFKNPHSAGPPTLDQKMQSLASRIGEMSTGVGSLFQSVSTLKEHFETLSHRVNQAAAAMMLLVGIRPGQLGLYGMLGRGGFNSGGGYRPGGGGGSHGYGTSAGHGGDYDGPGGSWRPWGPRGGGGGGGSSPRGPRRPADQMSVEELGRFVNNAVINAKDSPSASTAAAATVAAKLGIPDPTLRPAAAAMHNPHLLGTEVEGAKKKALTKKAQRRANAAVSEILERQAAEASGKLAPIATSTPGILDKAKKGAQNLALAFAVVAGSLGMTGCGPSGTSPKGMPSTPALMAGQSGEKAESLKAQKLKVIRVVDGDTVVLEKVGKVRIAGIDANESEFRPQTGPHEGRRLSQPGGQEASRALSKMLSGQTVSYKQNASDASYGRAVGSLSLNGRDVGEAMVSSGHAVARDKSLIAAETAAKKAKRGRWGFASAAHWAADHWRDMVRKGKAGMDQLHPHHAALLAGYDTSIAPPTTSTAEPGPVAESASSGGAKTLAAAVGAAGSLAAGAALARRRRRRRGASSSSPAGSGGSGDVSPTPRLARTRGSVGLRENWAELRLAQMNRAALAGIGPNGENLLGSGIGHPGSPHFVGPRDSGTGDPRDPAFIGPHHPGIGKPGSPGFVGPPNWQGLGKDFVGPHDQPGGQANVPYWVKRSRGIPDSYPARQSPGGVFQRALGLTYAKEEFDKLGKVTQLVRSGFSQTAVLARRAKDWWNPQWRQEMLAQEQSSWRDKAKQASHKITGTVLTSAAIGGGMLRSASPAAFDTLVGSFQLVLGRIGIMLIPTAVKFSYWLQILADDLKNMSDGTKETLGTILKWGGISLAVVGVLNLLFNAIKTFGGHLWALGELMVKHPFISALGLAAAGLIALWQSSLSAAERNRQTVKDSARRADDSDKDINYDRAMQIADPAERKKEFARLAAEAKQQELEQSKDTGQYAGKVNTWYGHTAQAAGNVLEMMGLAKSPDTILAGKEAETQATRRRRVLYEEGAATGGAASATNRASKQSALQNLAIAFTGMKAQPQYSSIDDAYKRIQIEALGKDPIQMELEKLHREGMLVLIEEVKKLHPELKGLCNEVSEMPGVSVGTK